ncbi:MAG: hypothetical protein ACYCS1_05080 [Gammaproteobacteria bacterium]
MKSINTIERLVTAEIRKRKRYKELNNLYLSKNPEDLIKFYFSFNSDKEIIDWLSKRRMEKQHVVVYNMPKNNQANIIAIIPTTDVNGEKAKRMKELLKDIPIIFNDTKSEYWSLAQSVNYAYDYAKKHYDFVWAIIANDDITDMDDIQKLKDKLKLMPLKDLTVVTVNKSLGGCAVYVPSSLKKILIKTKLLPKEVIDIHNISHKFSADALPITAKPMTSLGYWKDLLFYTQITSEYHNTGDFFIVNSLSPLFENNKIFDENYLNECEDVDLVLRANGITSYEFSFPWKRIRKTGDFYTEHIRFKVKSAEGGSLGTGYLRHLKSIVSRIYFNYKWDELLS